MELKFTTCLCILLCMLSTSQATENEKVCERSVTTANTHRDEVICKGALIFEDNFDYIDFGKWSHEVTMAGGGNLEFQIYLPNETYSFCQDGALHINPGNTADFFDSDFLYYGTLDMGADCTVSWNDGCHRVGNDPYILNPSTSARLHTTNKFFFKYGLIEARIKAPAGDWLWPTFWMMPQYSVYGDWPVSGEVDIFEMRGNRELFSQGTNIGNEQMQNTMHWGPTDRDSNQAMKTHWEINTAPGVGFDEDFHIFQMEWTPDYIAFSTDYQEIGRVTPPDGGFYEFADLGSQGYPNPWTSGSKMAPFDQEFFLILNMAVGGRSYFPDGEPNPGGKPWTNDSPTSFKEFWEGRNQWQPTWDWQAGTNQFVIDYVRVWAL